jgi:eukaryotic-like serine/threonine-protein kinase
MGEVYRARDTRLGRDVAIKALLLHMAHDPVARARFEREAYAVAALNHPHIVTIFSTEEADGVRFLTMELVEGRTLDQVIRRGGVSLAQFFDIAIALADALAAAHRKHLTHRDLKPANVMVSDDGRVKVLDLGLARSAEPGRLDESETVVPLTKAGTILGTIPYMSPEQIEGEPLDPRTDIFSLGIVLYEMAAGDRPFGGASSPALMSAILKDRPTPVSERRVDFPAGVSRLIDRCLEDAEVELRKVLEIDENFPLAVSGACRNRRRRAGVARGRSTLSGGDQPLGR